MNTLLQDLRYGARMLWKNKSFTIVSVTALALGIGFNTAIFSVVDTVLLRPLAYREPERLVSVWESNIRAGMARSEMAPANYLDLRAQNQVFEQVGAFLDQSITLTGRGEPERLDGQSVSANVLTLLGVQPLAGRTFLPNEDQPGQHQVVVLSYGLWQRRFNRDSGIVGQQITLDSQPFTVVGIMPRGFFFPQRDSELWTPLAMGPEQASGRGDHYLRVIARLKPGVSAQQAQAETESLAARLAADYPRTGLYKCRILYDGQSRNVSFYPYEPRRLRTIRVVHDDAITYTHKYEDRRAIDRLFAMRDGCDDVLIVRRGQVTDCSYSNVVFRKGVEWFTPEVPLLKGTMRQKLIDENKIRPKEILPGDIRSFDGLKVINAMLEFDSLEIEVSDIVF